MKQKINAINQEGKMYLTKKDRKIKTQQKLIEKLTEENECLKEQLESYNSRKTEDRIKLAEQAYQEYTELIMELNELKQEYIKLLEEMSSDKEMLKRKCR